VIPLALKNNTAKRRDAGETRLTPPPRRDIETPRLRSLGAQMILERATLRWLWCSAFGALYCALAVSLAEAQARPPNASVLFTTKVEMVQIPVIVFDEHGAVATGLKATDFRLYDDGLPQRILNFDRERVPVSFVILADLSSSMTNKIPFVQEAALSLVDTEEEKEEERAEDEYSIFGIGRRTKELLPFTRDESDLARRLPLLLTPTKESTSLFDGVWLGVATARHEAANKHRAMIILTDGGDNHSRYSLRETKKLLEEADLPVFAVMAGADFALADLFTPRQKPPKRLPIPKPGGSEPSLPFGMDSDDYIGPAERRGPYNMKELAEASGGGVFTARDSEDLPRIVRTIGLAVRYRYVLSYKPERAAAGAKAAGANGDGPAHKIRLELFPKEKFPHYSVPYYKRTYHSIE
jgi:Ca-activated chloride channel family protein